MERTAGAPLDSHGRLIVVAAVIFFATFFTYAHTDLPDVFYHLVVDGLLLAIWVLAGWGFGGVIVRGRSLLVQVTRIGLGLGLISLLILVLGLAGLLGEVMALVLLAVGFVLALADIGRIWPGKKNHWHGRSNNQKSKIQNPKSNDPHPGPPPVYQGRGNGVTVPNYQSRRVTWLSRPAGWHWLLLILMPFAGLMFAGGLVMPGLLWGADDPAGYDVVEYHLQVPRQWYEAGRITPLQNNVFSYFPFNVEMNYLLAMELHAGPWAGMFLAQWMHGTYMVLTVIAIYAAARALAPPAGACIAALAAGICPWLAMLGAVAYDEGGLLLYTALAIGWLLIGLKSEIRNQKSETNSKSEILKSETPGHRRDFHLFPYLNFSHSDLPVSSRVETFRVSDFDIRIFLLAGFCAGLACGCKLTAVPITLIALAFIYFICQFTWRSLAGAIVYVLAGLLAFSPWLIRNQFWAHNPVYPEGIAVFGPGHFTSVQVTRWRHAHSPRPDQQGAGPHFWAFWQQIISDWRYAYAVLPVAIIAGLLAIRRRSSVFLLLSVLAMILFWILLTHLQSRFFVLAIPLLALLFTQASKYVVRISAIIIALAAIPAYVVLHQHLMPASVTVGLESPSLLRSQLYPPAVNDAIDHSTKPIILVGDAKAFWYNIPMSRLHYRTVFDVQNKKGQSIVHAWMGAAANLPDADVIIDPGELTRFHRTYFDIPELPPQLRNLRGPTVFDLHDPLLSK